MTVLVAESVNVLSAAPSLAPCVREHDDSLSPKNFLQSRPPGVYTCVRVHRRTQANDVTLVHWSFHLTRLVHNVTQIDPILTTDQLDQFQRTTESLITTILSQWQSVDAVLSILWYPLEDGSAYGVAVHLWPLPPSPPSFWTLLIYGEGRQQASLKHTRWIQERKAIEEHKTHLEHTRGEPIHEVLLSQRDAQGERVVLEGLITNFFVGKERDQRVYTAPHDVLNGSMRDLVLQTCEALSIPVVYQAPKLSESTSWQAAFVTSTHTSFALVLTY
ncbi:hypothetical protein PsorP6_007306 [Peronosclerospora sorghi]|uniref:Uncharacterized protein n=1 Tax=Peronosclerospora sorghi TaxID=230839 RepID=A0ACC0W8X9_9STRA|nr:hypothetical protein PsorP6_007306 [Peronosclerospora sorghi]